MPLNSDALDDTRVLLNRAKQEIAQLKHANQQAQAQLKPALEMVAKLQEEIADLKKRRGYQPRAAASGDE